MALYLASLGCRRWRHPACTDLSSRPINLCVPARRAAAHHLDFGGPAPSARPSTKRGASIIFDTRCRRRHLTAAPRSATCLTVTLCCGRCRHLRHQSAIYHPRQIDLRRETDFHPSTGSPLSPPPPPCPHHQHSWPASPHFDVKYADRARQAEPGSSPSAPRASLSAAHNIELLYNRSGSSSYLCLTRWSPLLH